MMRFFMVAICGLQLEIPGLNKARSKAEEVLLPGLTDLHASLLPIH